MRNDETAPFDEPDPRWRGNGAGASDSADFEVDERSLQNRGPFPNDSTTEEQTRVLPQFDASQYDEQYSGAAPQTGSDAPTQAIGMQGGADRTHQAPQRNHAADAPTQRIATTGQRFAPPSQRAAAPQQSAHQQYAAPAHGPYDRDTNRELTAGGWWRLLIGGLLMLVAAWLLLRGAVSVVTVAEGVGYESLLNLFTYIGAPLLMISILLLPGTAGGRVGGILLAALSYGALVSPPLLFSEDPEFWLAPETGLRLVVLVVPAVIVLFGIMTWLSVRGKRGLAWVLVFLPTLVMVALTAVLPTQLGDLFPSGGLLPIDAIEQWISRYTTMWISSADMLATSLFALFAACVVPAVLLAWPFKSVKVLRGQARHG
ncbi:hypothetical protein [Agrococcus casei]|uniref:Uncharacterized protein n=1 Tax=Agrococcus casei LMG 22410 TaxID=1255656 RepID=A0A1R4GE68_9MICO|nr:hypothetical protein [Agrococcus casei]SJM66484.1 hypothetical protein CZ674_11225 [Agrococcus casei LMG 22410]